jgi:hypothetical protein
LDGVIADTAVYHFKAWRKLVKDHCNHELPDELEEKPKGSAVPIPSRRFLIILISQFRKIGSLTLPIRAGPPQASPLRTSSLPPRRPLV